MKTFEHDTILEVQLVIEMQQNEANFLTHFSHVSPYIITLYLIIGVQYM